MRKTEEGDKKRKKEDDLELSRATSESPDSMLSTIIGSKKEGNSERLTNFKAPELFGGEQFDVERNSLNTTYTCETLAMTQRSASRMQCYGENEGECFAPCLNASKPALLASTLERLTMKNFSSEVRALMDVEQFVSQGHVLLNSAQVSVEDLVGSMLNKALEAEHAREQVLEEARAALLVAGSSMLVAQTIQGAHELIEMQSQRSQLERDESWLCALCSLATISQRRMILARLKHTMNMGEGKREVALFMLILTPSKEKGTKNALETGRTFATMLAERELRRDLLAASSERELKALLMLKAQTLAGSSSLRNRHKYKLEPALHLSISSSLSASESNGRLEQVRTFKENSDESSRAASADYWQVGGKKQRGVLFSENPRAGKLLELLSQATPNKSDKRNQEPNLIFKEAKKSLKPSSLTASCCGQLEFGRGLVQDLKRRLKYYASDFSDAFVGPPKTLQKSVATVWFLYFGILLPTIAFSVLNRLQTHSFMGDLRKALVGQALGGLAFAFLSGQPLVIIMTTAPLCLYTKVIHQMCADYDFPFPAMYAAVGLWNCFFLAIYSLFGFSRLMKWCTRSTEEVFALFIVVAFISDAGKDLAKSFRQFYLTDECRTLDGFIYAANDHNNGSLVSLNGTTLNTLPVCRRETTLLFLILMFGTLWLATTLYKFRKTPFLETAKREVLADYALPTAVIAMSFVGSFLFDDIYVEKFPEPEELTFVRAPLENLPLTGVFTAMGLGFTLSLLFFMDQNISAAMVNAPQNKLKKGCAYHLDLLVVGILNAVLTLFGLPMMHGVLPHSPLHVRSLADIEMRLEEGHLREVITNVRETRMTGIVSHLLLLLTLLLIPYPIGYIPTAVLDGLFLYMAVTSLDGLQVFERILLLFTEQNKYPPNHYVRRCPQRKIHKFTLLQLLQLLVMCLFGFSPYNIVEMLFPVIILLMIPFRHKIVPNYIDEKYLATLDGKH